LASLLFNLKHLLAALGFKLSLSSTLGLALLFKRFSLKSKLLEFSFFLFSDALLSQLIDGQTLLIGGLL
jgi:hypothetical protein